PPGTRLRADAGLSRTPPLIVVEVVSPTPRDVHRDRVQKLEEYAGFGVRFYWLIDPEALLVQILELGADGRYAIALSACEGKHAAPGCEGLVLDLDDLWAEIGGLSFDEGAEGPTGDQ